MTSTITTASPPDPVLSGFAHEMREVVRYRELIANLVSRDLKVRYKRSALGFFWTMLGPLLMMIVSTVVFSSFFRFAIENFAIYFLSAFLLWTFFSQSTLAGMSVMLTNAGVLRRVYVPKTVFVVAAVISGLINWLLALLMLLLLMLVTGHPPTLNILWLPIPILAAFMFTLGISLLMASLGVFFADVAAMYQVLLTAWMYLTPIMYPLEIVPPQYLPLIHANPMYYLTETFRAPLYHGMAPDPTFTLYSFAAALVALVVGWWAFARGIDRFVYYL